MTRELVYLLAALLLAAAGAVGYLLSRLRARPNPAAERAAEAAAELQRRQDEPAAVRAASAIDARDAAATAARQRQEVGHRASETEDETLRRLGADPDGRVRQESAANPRPKPWP